MARTKRLEELSKENERLLRDLVRDKNDYNPTSPFPAVMDDYSEIHVNMDQCFRSDSDSQFLTNEEKLKIKLNSISALPRIKD